MRFRGHIGIQSEAIEIQPGIYTSEIREVLINGDIYPRKTTWPESKMSGASLNMILSILTPETTDIKFSEIVYVEYESEKWSVVGIEHERPRVKLTLGGIYNG